VQFLIRLSVFEIFLGHGSGGTSASSANAKTVIGKNHAILLHLFPRGPQRRDFVLGLTKTHDLFKTVGKAVELVGGELKFAKGYLSGFDFNVWLADRNPEYVVTSPRPNVLRIEHDGSANDFTLDPATWLPIKEAGVSLADPDRPVSAEMRFGGWTEVTGVRFSTVRTNYHSGVKMAEITTEGAIHVNAGLKPQDLASKPADFAPDIPASTDKDQ